ATNLVTAVADAFLDRAPLVALTGQGDLGRMHKESHQYIDVVSMMRPITKWNASLRDPSSIPEVVRKAFKIAEAEKPGATHIELPDNVMATPVAGRPLVLRHHRPALVESSPGELGRASYLIRSARNPVILAGNGVVRGRAAAALREFSEATGIPAAETFMGKGLLPADSPQALGAVGLQAGDYSLAGFDEADLVIAIGYDLVEHSPVHWNPRRDKRVICIDTVPAEIDGYFAPEVELVGDLRSILLHLLDECRIVPRSGGSVELHQAALRRLERSRGDDHFPIHPPRILWEIRQVLGHQDILVSDVGLHKLWIGRMFPAYEPGTVLIANGLAGMGFAVPAAIAAKLVHPDRRVIAISGDGGFLMNCQELETAVRLGTPFVNVVWEDGAFGSVAWKQERRFGTHFGTRFGNPDFVKLAESFGIPAWRIYSADELEPRLRRALSLNVPSLIVVPIDYSVDVAIIEELGRETVAT
ncbi:MAG TPA: acetolactate synthase large subunit, partial [Candidatus Sulfotelmatobacter sp.]|nr:acetolactate synthase large subunit [Candidatus Sulfotelmatobacter sp.]